MADQTPIKESDVPPTGETLTGGLADGQEVLNVVGEPTGEVVVYDYDKDNNIIGWHKEAAK